MKPARVLTVYIASSAGRNFHAVQLLGDALIELGHTVLDWTKLAPPLPEFLTPEQRKAALDSDERGEIFEFCTSACASADLVIYLGQAGQDAGCEVGIAYNAGVPVYGVSGKVEKPGTLMARAVTHWFQDTRSLLAAVTELAEAA